MSGASLFGFRECVGELTGESRRAGGTGGGGAGGSRGLGLGLGRPHTAAKVPRDGALGRRIKATLTKRFT